MKMPYKDLKSERLQSLVTVIKLLTLAGYFGFLLSAIGLVNMFIGYAMFIGYFNFYLFSYHLFIGSVILLVTSGILALLVGAEESYRQKVMLPVESIKMKHNNPINRTQTRWLTLRDFSQQVCASY